jgi:50S ribosomal subunit-associated GTPase HflX
VRTPGSIILLRPAKAVHVEGGEEEPDYSNKEESNAYYVSCKTGQGLTQIKQIIEKKIYKILEYIKLSLKISQGSEEMAYLYKNSIVRQTKDCDDSQYVIMNIMINKVNAFKFIKLFPNVTISK